MQILKIDVVKMWLVLSKQYNEHMFEIIFCDWWNVNL